jgi:deoxyribodipyrimidine photolyase-related protein
MKTLRLILGDQLNPLHHWFRKVDHNVVYVMMEIMPEATYVIHHIQKLVGYFAAMRSFAGSLESGGHNIIYLKLDDPGNKQSFKGNLDNLIKKERVEHFEYQLPDEWRLETLIHEYASTLAISTNSVDTEHFFTSRNEMKEFFSGKKTYLMESFYRHLRKKHDILMDGKEPAGGKWNYDKENRSRFDGSVHIPPPLQFNHDHSDIVDMIGKLKIEHIGNLNQNEYGWPVNRKESLKLLEHFLEHLLPYFGTFQDAMDTSSWSLFHSRLSFSMNTKMISPAEVVKATEARGRNDGRIALNQVEGFIRQILGWREYMRGIYWARMPGFSRMNFFRHSRKLPSFYWTGKTKMNCMKQSIDQSLNEAYAHHIQRLMVTGNFALLTGIDPVEVDKWYLGIYMDAIEWVEMPNTRGMSQFADGGITATKPYVSSANYINKMSNYCEDCHYYPSQRTGEKSCPFNSLYWHFMERNRDELASNPRIGMIYRSWDKMNSQKRMELLDQAESYLGSLENL